MMMKLFIITAILFVNITTESNPSVDWLTNNKQPVLQKQFKGETLMFTTPWNANGDILVKKYANKIDYYSPSIFDLIIKGKKVIIQNFDNYRNKKQVFERIKAKNPNIKILPRIYISGQRIDVIKELGGQRGVYNSFLDYIVKIAHQKYIDGFVWDSPFSVFTTEKKWVQVGLFMKQVTNDIKTRIGNKIIILNLANPEVDNMNYQQLSALKADGFSIQNYGQGGYLKCLENTHKFIKKGKFQSKKIFFTLPFFSKKNQNQLVSTEKVKQSVESNGYFDAYYDQICHIDTNGNKYQTPCPEYFQEAFKLIHPFNVGIWEGGNGVEQYYFLL